MSLNPLRALGSASCHRIFKDFDEIEHHQSHEMRGVAWLCEISLTPAWLQYAGIPHPTRPPASSPAPGGGGSRGDTRGKAVPGRANPRAGSFFNPSPYPGPWGIYTRGGGADGAGASLLSPGGVAPGEPEEHPPRISRMQGDMVQWFGAQRSPSLQKKIP
jgi:hypothetical protein